MNAPTHPYLTSVEVTSLLHIRSHASEELKTFLAEFEIAPLVLGSGEKRKHYRWLRQDIEARAEQIKSAHKARRLAAKQAPAPTPQLPLPGVEAAPQRPDHFAGEDKMVDSNFVEALARSDRERARDAERLREQISEFHDMVHIGFCKLAAQLSILTPTAEV